MRDWFLKVCSWVVWSFGDECQQKTVSNCIRQEGKDEVIINETPQKRNIWDTGKGHYLEVAVTSKDILECINDKGTELYSHFILYLHHHSLFLLITLGYCLQV